MHTKNSKIICLIRVPEYMLPNVSIGLFPEEPLQTDPGANAHCQQQVLMWWLYQEGGPVHSC